MDDPNWIKLLKLLLSFGNCINAGGPKGKAFGFRLSSLTKFADTKDFSGTNTMLYYIWKLGKSIDDRTKDEEKDK